ncbi:MAG: anhydro-N-acetylmuramic acid kinase [Raineya sp.]|nr:anhydro-N-acetylmuramic acid kinase [Raineya sp.]
MLQQLYQIAHKTERKILGLMSGTSLDGLDIALCKFNGAGLQTQVELLAFETIPYSEPIRSEIQKVFAKKNTDLEQVTLLHNFLGKLYAEFVKEFLQKNHLSNREIDLIASHGQTIFHAPKHLHQKSLYGNATLQIADADQIAYHTGIVTISDFRQKHIAAGGEGAPLAIYGDFLLFKKAGENRILLNIGGIANFTFLPATCNPQEVWATDTGVGNTFLDYFTQKFFQKFYDENGEIAQSGTCNDFLLEKLLENPFFGRPFPKSTGQETFNYAWVEEILQKYKLQISPSDLLCTLTHFTAQGILKGLQAIHLKDLRIYVSGGGAKNKFLLKILQEYYSVQNFDVLGIPADAKEAVLFALLANETITGSRVAIGQNPCVCMGKISLPY